MCGVVGHNLAGSRERCGGTRACSDSEFGEGLLYGNKGDRKGSMLEVKGIKDILHNREKESGLDQGSWVGEPRQNANINSK